MAESKENMNNIDYTTPTPRFSVKDDQSLDAGMAYLNEHGYAVISDVLDSEEIALNKDLLWKFLEASSEKKIQRDNPETWSNEWPSFSTHGVISGGGVGQSEFLWNVRSNERVKKIFARIWNTKQLLTSFDGCGIYRDWRFNPSWKTQGGWNHVDQNPVTKPDRCCIQSLVSLTDQNEKTGGLIVYPKTHLNFTQLSDLTKKYNDFIKVPNTHPVMDPSKTRGKLVHCQAGDLVLWDSRTVHCNTPAVAIEPRRDDQPADLLRIVAYVSMSPPSFIKGLTLEEFREKRKEMVENNCTLTHWSTELAVGGGVNTDLPKLSLDNFTPRQKALILGLEDNSEE